MKHYSVKKNETLVKIAHDNGFKTIAPILHANLEKWPQLEAHHNVLVEGMTILIPDKKVKEADQATGTSVVYHGKKKAEQHLYFNIDDFHNEIQSVVNDVTLIINGAKVPIKDNTNYDISPVLYKSFSTLNPLPDGEITNSKIKLKLKSILTGNEYEKEIILEVGGLDPFLDPRNDSYSGKESDHKSLGIAAQKILMNLGFYQGELDGDIDKSESQLAIARFQTEKMELSPDDPEYGKPGVKTCVFLGMKQGIYLGPFQKIKYANT